MIASYILYRQFLGPVVSGALTEIFDFQTSSLVSEEESNNSMTTYKTFDYVISAFW